ncbi:ATP-binding protein [Mitsuaria sp. GD03876]|uniref:sensor histidine kinase n=1 Tax=Mitsuaria sp. GD03876 TaxID=2975399 RepID=UPI00244D19C8|nr:ATP-binding protein [Mitsuaria sp. GD03876]MDH0864701.1 HAMP domain-containing histidine kinase [Mitsuaria sp. GD03876]
MPFTTPTWLSSLTLKVMLAYVAGVLLTIATLALIFNGVTTLRGPLFFDEDITEFAEELGENLHFDASGAPTGLAVDEQRREWLYRVLKDDLAYRVLDASGRVVIEPTPANPIWPAAGEGARVLRPGKFEFTYAGQRMQGATEAVPHQGRTWYLQLAGSARLFELFRLDFALPFMGMGMVLFSSVMLLLFGVCVFVMLKRVLKPLHDVSATAAAISPRWLHARLQVDRVPSEIVPLVESFNRVLERLERGYRVQQEFLAMAAHELKTPLALIRAQVEFMEKGQADDSLLQDVEHMTRQVQQLLLLAEASEVQNYQFQPTDMGAAAQEAIGYLRRMADALGVEVELRVAGEGTTWDADRGAVFTLLKNLLENALQHAPAGSRLSVEVGERALSVRDRGPGVTPEQLSRMFGRFWRGAHRRDHGAGLGLAICQEIADAHGWTLSAERESPGLRMVVVRPEDGAPAPV